MSAARTAWLGYWGLMRRWHRYEVTGLQHLLGGQAVLIVGYHGRPIAHDLCMLTVEIHEKLGYLPHGIIHNAFERSPRLKAAVDDLGFVMGDGPGIERAVAKGEHILVAPGGTREGCRSFRDRYHVTLGKRTGYLALAARHRLPIVPVAAAGIDDVIFGLNEGHTLGKRLGMPPGLPFWVGLGPLGIWPLTPTFPVKVSQHIGPPIAPPESTDRKSLGGFHTEVVRTIQALLDRARGLPA